MTRYRIELKCFSMCLVILSVLGIVTHTPVWAQTPPPAEPPASSPAFEWAELQARSGLFTIRYPATWAVSDDGEVTVFSPSTEAVENTSMLTSHAVFVVIPNAYPTGTAMQGGQALDFWLSSLQVNWNDPVISDRTHTLIGDRQAAAAQVTGVDRETEIPFKMQLILLEHTDRYWLLMAVAPQPEWDAAWPIMAQMLNSFHLSETAAAPQASPEPDRGDRMEQWELEFGAETGPGRLTAPQGLAVDPHGRIYVMDAATNRIQVYDREGTFLFAFGETGSQPGQFNFMNRGALVFDEAGNLYVVDRGNQRVQQFDAEAQLMRIIGEDRLRSPQGIAAASSGEIYVSDEPSCSVMVFASNGQFVRAIKDPDFEEKGIAPSGVAIGPQDYLYVTYPIAQSVQAFDPDGQLLATWGSQSSEASYLAWPIAVAVDTNGHFYVADTELGLVKEFDTRGQPLISFGDRGENKRILPTALALDGSGHLFVADTKGGRVLRFDLEAALAAEDLRLQITNGNFEQGLEGWRLLDTGEPPSGSQQINAVRAGRLQGQVLEIQQTGMQEGETGTVGVYRPLDIDVSELSSLYLAAQIMVRLEEGGNIGAPDPERLPEGAVLLKVIYEDRNGRTGEWYHGFYSRNVPGSDTGHFTTVPLEEWYPYRSNDLLTEIPELDRIVGLQIYGSGQNFIGQVDDVRFLSE